MFSGYSKLLAMGLLLGAVGCASDKPHSYGEDRPPVDTIDSGDRGLQSKDVVSSSDQMAMDLLALPELNASRTRWTIVVGHVENLTSARRGDLDIFLERLRTRIAELGHGRVALIENRATYHKLQSDELEPSGGGDQYGQGGGDKSAPGSAGIQPDFELYGRIMELPNRSTDYFLCEFTLTDLHTREQVWTRSYEVRTSR
jgi:Peptidoglycan-synthase activator LpoB